MPLFHAEAPRPTAPDMDPGRRLDHRVRTAFQLELARRMTNLAELGVLEIEIHDPKALTRLHDVMEGLSAETKAAADERMTMWARQYMDAFRGIVDAAEDGGALIRHLIRTDPESALARVQELLLGKPH